MSSLFFPAKVKARCHFIKKVEELKDVMDIELLPSDLNGKGNFDMNQWIETHKKREQDGTLITMTSIGASAACETK